MACNLIRGVRDAAVERLDAESAAIGLSRHEYLRRRLEREARVRPASPITEMDWIRSAANFRDLADPDLTDAAWR
ncbi:type II toxin-antitoxin system VapB family antitoxin [Brachybacterium paraconglomeratum]|uniref:type II toxin-antitoxin system VapB family antitoxin n=1 Tax=Brachybacterium paraconglomeratum TaxID=173362 RepID=UPI003F7BAB0A